MRATRMLSAVALVCGLTAPVFNAGFCAGAEREPNSGPARVVVVEWIPLHSHALVVQAFQEALDADETEGVIPAVVTRINVFGDEDKLTSTLRALASDPRALLLGFGDHVCQAARRECPNVSLLAVLVRDRRALDAIVPDSASTLTILSCEPDPELVWKVVRELVPNAKRLGIVYTAQCAANIAFADALERVGKKSGGRVVPTTVPPGFCRTDSDFEKALAQLTRPGEGIDVLFVPDDPNGARFGVVIYEYATQHGIPAIGTDATLGKGCVVALAADYQALGARAAAICRDAQSEAIAGRCAAVPSKIVLDPNALERHKLHASPWLTRVTKRAERP